jgi:hypothetical protein
MNQAPTKKKSSFKSLTPMVLTPILIWFWIFEPILLPEHA